ncbi:unnamed protein product [Clonostachys rhizophaga]|uniref:Alpha/beta hydrolase fold-3 domain-containing protein n=1 Tax=Clonostachys rhizophaga TaxID=160324 RepID=A0A9N9VAK6_9HYPO|nr:unnamed protein product [Clonostachys rhizophaga]
MSNPRPITFDPRVFDPSSITEEAKAFDAKAKDVESRMPKIQIVGAKEMRRMRLAGETARPPPTLVESATVSSIPSREPGRSIPIRILTPQNGKPIRGVYMHIHGGGWSLADESFADLFLQGLADGHGLVCVSIGYRLAPEHPFPAGPEDCYDAVEWLVLNSEATYKVPLAFIGGDSAGGHLSMLTGLHLLQHSDERFSSYPLKGLMLHFGAFSLNFMPSGLNMTQNESGLNIDYDAMVFCRDQFLPGWTHETLIRPDVSPLYTNLEPLRGKLYPVLFTCGTRDVLIDDTLFMSVKWLAAGGEAVVEIVPGAQHGYIMAPRSLVGSGSEQGMAAVDRFIEDKLQLYKLVPTWASSKKYSEQTTWHQAIGSHTTMDDFQKRIDSLLESYLEFLDEYTRLRAQLSKLQAGVYQNIARANFSAERGLRYGQDQYDERMQASRLLRISAGDNGEDDSAPRFHVEKFNSSATETPPATEPDRPSSGEEEQESDDAAPQDGKNERDENSVEEEKKEEKPIGEEEQTTSTVRKDPLFWFGLLAPMPLRNAQSLAIEAMEQIIPRLVTVNAEMLRLEIEVGRARKRRAKFLQKSKAELVPTEAEVQATTPAVEAT